jgi:signal transduction histidine kinase
VKNWHHHPWDKDDKSYRHFKAHRNIWHEKKERFVFRRFFGPIMSVLFLVILAFVVGTVIVRELSGSFGVLIAVGSFFILLLLGAISYIDYTVRHVSKPFVEVMSAVDMVAKGDLSVRVSEDFPGEFNKLTKSFNHMVTELEEAENNRRRLTADVAHELRTPLHILQGNLEGMQDGIYPMDEDQVKLLLEETKILSRLVDDLQILSLAESKQLSLNFSDINVNGLLSEAAAGFISQAESLGIELVVSSSTNSGIISGDRERLGQVIRNIITNGLRFTPSGGEITISSIRDNGDILIQISDTGEGITEENLSHIFDRFWKGDQSRARQTGVGSGLGLSIAKSIVDMHHGEISVESQLNQGTTFTIRLPIVNPAES